jgi:hypothetical protein
LGGFCYGFSLYITKNKHLLLKFYLFAYYKFKLVKYFKLINHWRIKGQISLSTIINFFFFMPVFRFHSFHQADILSRNKFFKTFFSSNPNRKVSSLISNSHMHNLLYQMNSNQIREVNYKEYKLVDKREYTYYGLRVGIIDGSSYSKQ